MGETVKVPTTGRSKVVEKVHYDSSGSELRRVFYAIGPERDNLDEALADVRFFEAVDWALHPGRVRG